MASIMKDCVENWQLPPTSGVLQPHRANSLEQGEASDAIAAIKYSDGKRLPGQHLSGPLFGDRELSRNLSDAGEAVFLRTLYLLLTPAWALIPCNP